MEFDSKSASRGLMALGGLFLGVVTAISVTTNPSGGLAALVPLITVILSLVAITKPRLGLFALVPLVVWVDEFKRLAVYYGGAYSMTVYQTLAMPFVVLACLNIGFFLNVLFDKAKFDRLCMIFYALATIIGGGVFITMDGSFPDRVQREANLAGYITLIPIAYTYLKTFDEWRSFFSLQVMIALPAAAWAIKQYYFGFDQIEWTYALSGLSRVHSGQMLMFAEPRVFGFFGSASALGCAGIYCAFSWWHFFQYRSHRFFWLACAVILSWVLVVSTQRTLLVYPLIIAVCAVAFRTQLRLAFIYSAAFVTLGLGIGFSDYLLAEGLDNINEAIESDSGWGSRVLKVSTFSDRLVGWQRLKRASSWSWLGTGRELQGSADAREDTNHDVINKILIGYGAVGLVGILVPAIIVISVLHKTALNADDKNTRNHAAFALALALPGIGMAMLGGDNFNTNPINIQIWTCFAGVIVCRNQILEAKRHKRRDFRSLTAQSPASSSALPAPIP